MSDNQNEEPINTTDENESSDEECDYDEMGYLPIGQNDDENDADFETLDDDEEVSEITQSEVTIAQTELTFDDFDADFEKALAFVLKNESTLEKPKSKKKKIRILLGAENHNDKYQHIEISDNSKSIVDDEVPTLEDAMKIIELNDKERSKNSDINLNDQSLLSIKNLMNELDFKPREPSWFTEEDWLIKLKKIKDEDL